jgi:uncharacterized protein (TIGR02145 family)
MNRRPKLMGLLSAGLVVLMLNACKKDKPDELLPIPSDPIAIVPDSVDLGVMRTVDVIGLLRDESGAAIAGATVYNSWGNEQTSTDILGFFRFENMTCYSQSAFIHITKPGYFDGYRSWIPNSSGYDRVEMVLMAKNETGSFLSSEGGQVQAELITLNFPPNVCALHGETYSGTVHVAVNWIDPSDVMMLHQQMPGNLSGRHDGAWKVLRSFGMAAVQITADNGEELEMVDGSSVEMLCELPAELQADAPAQIPLWHFNEDQGFWEYEGVANRTANTYVAHVSHFSYWNFDVEGEAIPYTVTVNYAEIPIGYYPLDNAVLMLTSPSIGTIPGTTGTNGEVTGLVPTNEVMQLQVFLYCDNGLQEVYTTTVGPFTIATTQVIEISSLPYVATINGSLLDCDGNPASGYVWLNNNSVVLADNGAFTLTTCSGSNSIHAYCYSGGNAGEGNEIIPSLQGGTSGVVINCDNCNPIGQPGSGVTDIDGNFYPTVRNGQQEWMAENLAVTHFANGDAIQEVSDAAQWASATAGAWCYLDNIQANDVVFGKLYNAFVTEDSRNVCPAGWHVPSNLEWQELVNFLGGSTVAGSALRALGTIQDGNGWWNYDNVITTNVSGFDGQPSGYRQPDGSYPTQVQGAIWWSNTLATASSYYTVGIYSFSNNSFNQDFTRPQGFSVRCLRD